MLTHINNDIPVQLAYASLYNFFDAFTLPWALDLTDKLVYTACCNHTWRKNAPGDLLYFVEHLQELCLAAVSICLNDMAASRADIPSPGDGMPDTGNLTHFVNPKYGVTQWDCMPRHLSARQYHRPGRMLCKFVDTMPETQWQNKIKLLLEFALSNNSVEGCLTMQELLLVRKRLLQLLEACHLIVVRVQDAPVKKRKK